MYLQFLTGKVGYMIEADDIAMQSAFITIKKTMDGGVTWNKVSSQDCKLSSDFTFIDEKVGFMNRPINGGAESELYYTNDGGVTYNRVVVKEGVLDKNSSTYVDGLSWSKVYDYYNIPVYENGILSLEISQGSDGDYNGGTVAKYISKDMGVTWEFVEESK
ncbi:hypothetical protein D3C73_1111190 [compost metagenome]